MILSTNRTGEQDSAAAIVCENVVRVFRTRSIRHRALRGISLAVAPGEKLAITGPSGSGKSTLLQLLAGLDRPSSGCIQIFGQMISDMTEQSLTQFRKQYIGFVFQDFGLLDMSALENVAFPLMVRGVPRDERKERAADLLSGLGLGKHFGHSPDELSGGQQQRVAIARALIAEPRLLLCDEPTGSLDSSSADQIMDLLVREADRRQMTLVVVTHDLQRLEWASRTVRIQDGLVTEAEEAGK